MKKNTIYLMIMVLLLSIFPDSIMASEGSNSPITKNNTEMPVEVKTMINRLEEIKAMDKSAMSRVEKKELRKEVRAIKSSLKSSGNGGVYLSVGAIIIIVLLLIILL